jgi:mono/diheme cytochrome c family protein
VYFYTRRARKEASVLANRSSVLRSLLLTFVIVAGWSLLSSVDTTAGATLPTPTTHSTQAAGLAEWQRVYSVLIFPRCINCHTATNYPQQGDDRRRHFANVIRGPEGKGVAGLNCASCHQEKNSDATGVPGGHNWHLAPLSMRWQNLNDKPLSSAAVCRALIDRAKNHGLDGPGLLKHHEEEALVLWAWNPGRRPDGTMRSLPPLTHAQLVDATRQWVAAGTPCPKGP